MPKATLRKSGNSAVLVVSPDFMKERNLRFGHTYEYDVFPEIKVKDLVSRSSRLKRKMSTQKIMDMVRRGW